MSRTRMTNLIFILPELSSLGCKSYKALYFEYRQDIFMRLYGSVEEVVTMCLVYKIWRLLCSYPPKQNKILGFGFFVKIHLLQS